MTEEEILSAADAILRKRVEPLASLWNETKTDWYLNISWSVTEPVCPFSCLNEKQSEKPVHGYWGDGPIEAILKTISAARAAMGETG